MFRFNHNHQGEYYSSLLKLLFLNNQLKYIGVVNLVVWPHTGCNRRNVRDFGRVFLRSNYTDITRNTYIQS